MESEVIRLRVSWRRDASSDEALQAVVKAVHNRFGTRLATDGEAATQMALRYEDDDDGEMCRLTALTLGDCLDMSSNIVKLFVEGVPLEARADRLVILEVQDSAEVQADETSLSAVMSVDSVHRSITVEAAADVCKGPLCCGGGREAHYDECTTVDLCPSMAGRLDRRGVLRCTLRFRHLLSTPEVHFTTHRRNTTHARVGALRPMPHCLGIGSTRVGPGRTPTVHTCSLRGGGRGWLIHETTILNSIRTMPACTEIVATSQSYALRVRRHQIELRLNICVYSTNH